MKRLFVVILVVVGVVIGGSVAVMAAGNSIPTPIGDQPDLTPRMTIVEPSKNHFKAGEPIPVVISYSNFHADPSLRCNPAGTCLGSLPNTVVGTPAVDVGHVHVYFTPNDGTTVQATSFCIPGTVNEVNFAGTISGNCPALTEKGEYRMSAEFQSNSHVSSLKAFNSPQHIPTSDVVIFNVN